MGRLTNKIMTLEQIKKAVDQELTVHSTKRNINRDMNYNLDIDINLLKKQKEVLVNEAYTLLRSTYPKQQEEGQLYQGIISVLDSIQDQYEQTTSKVLKEYTVSATDTTHYQVTIKASSQEEAQEIAENMHQEAFDVDHNDGGYWDICSVLEV